MPPESTRGVVLWSDGRTPVYRLRVRVWDADEERCIYRTRTDENGVFAIPELGEGNHYVTVGPVKIELNVFKERAGLQTQQNGIVVVLPRALAFPSDLSPVGALAASALPDKIRRITTPKIVSP